MTDRRCTIGPVFTFGNKNCESMRQERQLHLSFTRRNRHLFWFGKIHGGKDAGTEIGRGCVSVVGRVGQWNEAGPGGRRGGDVAADGKEVLEKW